MLLKIMAVEYIYINIYINIYIYIYISIYIYIYINIYIYIYIYQQGVPYWGIGVITPLIKNLLIHLVPGTISHPIKTSFLTVVIGPAPFLILTSYFLYTQVMLILTLIDVQYLQNDIFYFEKNLNDQMATT